MSQLSFDPDTGLTAPETAAIRAAVADDWTQAFNTGDGSPVLDTEAATPAGQLIDSETALVAAANAAVLYLANMFNPTVADGKWQDALAAIYFLTRQTAEATVVTCQCSGLAGTVIPVDALCQDVGGNRYACTAAVTLGASGVADVIFACTETGPVTCAAGSVTQIVTVIPGWDSVNNVAAGATGRNAESRADFEARRYASVSANAHGSVAALQGALCEVPGVLDCQVLENSGDNAVMRAGVTIAAHSVAVCIYGGADTTIAKTIYQKKSGGCGTVGGTQITYIDTDNGNAEYTYNIVRPTPATVAVQVTINQTTSTPATIETDIQNAVVNDFLGQDVNSGNTRVGMASTVYASRFSVALIKTAGVVDLVSVEIGIAGGALGNAVTIDGDVEPVMTASDVTVVINR